LDPSRSSRKEEDEAVLPEATTFGGPRYDKNQEINTIIQSLKDNAIIKRQPEAVDQMASDIPN
jgi:hypothetical protein